MTDTTILRGIVGSTAYGLAHEGSDIDRLGCFVAPSESFWGLAAPERTHVTTHPDVTMHEVGKLCALALKCNPTITELLWLDSYEVRTTDGDVLIAMRSLFLSAPYVRNAHLEYATQQFRKLSNRGGTFSSDLGKRTEKHARHLLRLLKQGFDLYSTGHLSVLLDDPERYHQFGRDVAQDPSLAAAAIGRYEALFDATTSLLPDKPDADLVNAALIDIRRGYLLTPYAPCKLAP